MLHDYWGYAATLLADGRVLIAGGMDSGEGPSYAAAEIYNPKTGVFEATGSMLSPRSQQTATRLVDGRVLIAGGYDGEQRTALASAELYQP